MNLRELRRELQRLDRGDIAAVRHFLSRARPALGARWLDQAARDQLEQLAQLAGEPISLAPIADLGCGETWLLLATGDGVGDVARAAIRPRSSVTVGLAPEEVERALSGLAIAAGAEMRSLTADSRDVALQVPGDPGLQIEGTSLGLAVCVAVCSRVTGRAPRTDVAGSAAVGRDGRLSPVTGLREKCLALRARWPAVATVVIAREQELPQGVDSLSFERASTVGEALPHYGLDLKSLPRLTKRELKVRLEQLALEEERHHPSSRWFSLSAEAWEVSRMAQLDEDERPRAMLLSALLASHAGANPVAMERLRELPDARCDAATLARKLIYLGSFGIEIDPTRAVEDARRGLELAKELTSEPDRKLLCGRASGTLGRALMATGQFEAALVHLRAGFDHHEGHTPEETARSACYWACGLRMAGRLDEALSCAGRAVELAREHSGDADVARTSLAYALLERGRALAARGRLEEAVVDLQEVVATKPAEEFYPALGGRRSLVTTFRRLGLRDEARDMLLACVRVARGTAFLTLRRVGGVAAMEELRAAKEDGREPLLPRSDLEGAWTACFEAASGDDVLRNWVY